MDLPKAYVPVLSQMHLLCDATQRRLLYLALAHEPYRIQGWPWHVLANLSPQQRSTKEYQETLHLTIAQTIVVAPAHLQPLPYSSDSFRTMPNATRYRILANDPNLTEDELDITLNLILTLISAHNEPYTAGTGMVLSEILVSKVKNARHLAYLMASPKTQYLSKWLAYWYTLDPARLPVE